MNNFFANETPEDIEYYADLQFRACCEALSDQAPFSEVSGLFTTIKLTESDYAILLSICRQCNSIENLFSDFLKARKINLKEVVKGT